MESEVSCSKRKASRLAKFLLLQHRTSFEREKHHETENIYISFAGVKSKLNSFLSSFTRLILRLMFH
ncbi:CLUMA_CG001804, isoform A [Clunio marinus]|uniref:CLUMA_CG001804, isoform A n=1 Tax=Clunio marinus TaxID=568069 RepID=A0A1J1HKF5_9DIPT|nr:CLUMA_CG001804, isoform A [Clunio marinus]